MRRSPVALALAAAALASAAPAADRASVAKLRQSAREFVDRLHVSPESVSLDAVLAELDQRAAAGQSPPVLADWLRRELMERWYDFAPIEPEPQARHRYRLPFDRRVHWIVGQGVSTEGSHRGSNELALDFVMPEGTEVLAARRGRVARVVDGFTECCLPLERSLETNVVLVLHRDGTFATYAHLRPGIPVKEGQRVREGELLGYSGNTGYSAMPHLHFQLSVRRPGSGFRSVSFRFGNATPEGYLPKPWRLYDNRVAPAARLRVSVDGNELASGEPFQLPTPVPAQLRIELLDAVRGPIDVTRHPGTRYVPLTPWSLRVDPGGLVVFETSDARWRPMPEFVRHSAAIVTILFRDPEGREGFFDAWLVPGAVVPPSG